MRFNTLQQILFLVLLLATTALFLWIIHDYMFALFWALVFGIVFHPVQLWWEARTRGRRNLASALTLITIIAVIFIPLAFIINLMIDQSITLYQAATGAGDSLSFDVLGNAREVLVYGERFGIDAVEAQARLVSWAQSLGQWFTGQVLSWGQKTFVFFAQLFIMLYLLFFIFRDGDRLRARLIEILPLGNARERLLFRKFASTTRAVVKGTLVIAIIQGIVGGILFWIAGVTAPVLWAVLMAVFAIIPVLGTILVWLPVGIVLLVAGSLWQGLLVLIGGWLIVGLIDNILRPLLVGKDTEMPDALVLLSTLGGLAVFGMAGFVLGPVIAAFFLALWYLFEKEYKIDLVERG